MTKRKKLKIYNAWYTTPSGLRTRTLDVYARGKKEAKRNAQESFALDYIDIPDNQLDRIDVKRIKMGAA